jgi:hypothetical protein
MDAAFQRRHKPVEAEGAETRATALTFFNLWNSLKTAKILKNNHWPHRLH